MHAAFTHLSPHPSIPHIPPHCAITMRAKRYETQYREQLRWKTWFIHNFLLHQEMWGTVAVEFDLKPVSSIFGFGLIKSLEIGLIQILAPITRTEQ